MNARISSADRRQFGRRPVNAEATAVLPGHVELPCLIENLSEGGAFLHFANGLAPTQAFLLVVAETQMRLQCEIRHFMGARLGIQFSSPAQGQALFRQFHKEAATPVARPIALPGTSRVRPAVCASVREFRRAVIGPTNAPTADPHDGVSSTMT